MNDCYPICVTRAHRKVPSIQEYLFSHFYPENMDDNLKLQKNRKTWKWRQKYFLMVNILNFLNEMYR